ncbi:MAG: hypothetical protein IE889_05810 [Campylobacterales bacterium]|nr:hypothetical protein [Campylobacterales bacterium]
MFGEFDEMVLYHALLIKMVLGLLVVGMVIPFLSSDCTKTINRKRIYMFFLHGLLAAVAFGGLVAMVFAQISFDLSMAVMIVAYIAMSVLESIKYLTMVKSRSTPEICNTVMRKVTLSYTPISILIIVLLVVWKVMEP